MSTKEKLLQVLSEKYKVNFDLVREIFEVEKSRLRSGSSEAKFRRDLIEKKILENV